MTPRKELMKGSRQDGALSGQRRCESLNIVWGQRGWGSVLEVLKRETNKTRAKIRGPAVNPVFPPIGIHNPAGA